MPRPQTAPLIVDGDAEGISAAADVGFLAGNPTVLYAATLAGQSGAMAQEAKSGATLVVTDTDRKRGFRWNSVAQNAGYTQTASEKPANDPTEEPIDSFLPQTPDSQTVTEFEGVKSSRRLRLRKRSAVPAGGPCFGSARRRHPDRLADLGLRRPGRPMVAGHARPSDQNRSCQPAAGDQRLANQMDHRSHPDFRRHQDHARRTRAASRSPSGTGQTVAFPTTTFTTLRVTIDGTNLNQAGNPASLPGVGFAEVRVPGVKMQELVSLPQDMLRSLGSSSTSDRLAIILTRLRVAPEPPRGDPETSISRIFWLPSARTFMLTGEAAIDPLIPDDAIDRLVGRPGSNGTGIVAYSSGRLPGDLRDGAEAAVDENPATMWSAGFGAEALVDPWIEVNLPSQTTVHHLDLQVVADGHHSVPTSVRVDGVQHAARQLVLRRERVQLRADHPSPHSRRTAPG